jgi:hypothetical protein
MDVERMEEVRSVGGILIGKHQGKHDFIHKGKSQLEKPRCRWIRYLFYQNTDNVKTPLLCVTNAKKFKKI